MNRRTLLAALSTAAAFALPATSEADAPTKVSFEISNETGGNFQTYIKSLGDEYSLPTPAKTTSKATVPVSNLALLMFQAGNHGEKKRAYSVSLPDDAGAKLTAKIVARTDAKGVYVASALGAELDEINVLMYVNS